MGRAICIDPSGSHGAKNGMGSTGLALLEDGKVIDFQEVSAEKFPSVEYYWHSICERIDEQLSFYNDDEDMVIVCESFKLQPGKAMAQSWSDMATPQLIGYLRMHAWFADVPFIFQDPSCKPRFADPVLVHLDIIQLINGKHYCNGKSTNLHMRDAIRHGVYYFKYTQKRLAKKGK